jgi:glycosyltransferase involved in cell wall biosynthesis
MENPIILSICIPTYNRAEYLEATIHSIVNQKRFKETNEVEIVISDNCSDDNTREVCEKYITIYSEKIRYYRNTENIKDKNFEKVLSYGRGVFLKLNNDTLMHQNNTLDIIIDAINQNIIKKDIIFFSNGTNKNITNIHCANLDSFIKTVSFYSTWIACFGIWKDDFDAIENFSRIAHLQLVQTDVLLRLISSNRSVMVCNTKIFYAITPKSQKGYNFFEVFVTNYLSILLSYMDSGKVSIRVFRKEKINLYKNYIIPRAILYKTSNTHIFAFETKGALKILYRNYWNYPYFYVGAIKYIILLIRANHFVQESILYRKLKQFKRKFKTA